MYIVIGKIKKLKTKFKCLEFEIGRFDNMRLFHAGIGDDYHFTHSRKSEDKILLFNSFIHRDNDNIKHVAIIFDDIKFINRLNCKNFLNMLNKTFIDDLFEVCIYTERDAKKTKSLGFDCAYNADYLRSYNYQ